MFRKTFLTAFILGLFCVTGVSQAVTITFDDLTTRDNFFDLGIESTYQGFEWGYSNSPGLAGSIVPTNQDKGWASQTVADPAINPAPTPVSGNSSAWNWDGPQSLFIDFQTPYDVSSAYFATLSSNYGSNASTVQMFGYNSAGTQVASSATLGLTDSFQLLNAGFSNVRYLEMRANANGRWFSIDNLTVNPASVPEPTSMVLLGLTALGGLGVGYRRRRKNGEPAHEAQTV